MKINNDLFSVKDKVICISGSSRDLGKALGLYFAAAGARVVLSSPDEVELKLSLREFEEDGLKADLVVADVSKSADCQHLVQQVVAAHGKIDTMICNAGIDINLRGAYCCAKFAAQEMIGRGSGSSIMTSSIAGHLGISGLA